jgi:DNA-binding transcriptional LysR family regulator
MQKKVSAVCAVGATLNGETLQTMARDALPFFLSAAQAVPNPDPTVKIIIDGITLANSLLPGVIAQLNAAAPIITVATPAK